MDICEICEEPLEAGEILYGCEKCGRMACRKCGRGANDINGYLHRVNEKGVIGIWECRPYCNTNLTPDEAVVAAITGEYDVDFQRVAEWLYAILDDIDSAGDMSKGNDALYRKTVERLQRLKSEVGHSPDGHQVVFRNPSEDYGLTRLFTREAQ